MKYKSLLYALVLWAGVAFGAEGTLSGVVTGSEGEAIPGANVVLVGDLLPGGKIGTATDEDGLFRLEGLPAGEYQLNVTHIGYRALTREGVGIVAGEQELMLTLETGIIFLDQNVVSASRRQEKVLEAPASVAIVEAAEIRNRPALSVVEHIRDLPGVDFSQTGLAQSNVVVRGFNNVFSGALLTLTDNRIARVPSLRLNAYNFIPVTNDDIERIEVVLGPGSALYGPNSANGVMHIITRSPFTSAGTNVNLGLGERSVRKVGMRHAGAASDRLGYKVSAQYYTGVDWEYQDPVEVQARAANPDIPPRNFDIETPECRSALGLQGLGRLDGYFGIRVQHGRSDRVDRSRGWPGPRIGRTTMFSFVYCTKIGSPRSSRIGATLATQPELPDTFTLRDGKPIVDNSKMTAFQLQHST